MNPKKRKKEPPDPSFHLYGSLCGGCFPSTPAISWIYSEPPSLCPFYSCLNLNHCRIHLPRSGRLCLPSPVLNLLVLDGPRSSTSLTRGCLWAYHLALIVAGAASPVAPICVFDLARIAQAVVEVGCYRAVHILREELCRSSSNCGSSLASAEQFLGILRDGFIPDAAMVDPSSRFVLVCNLDVFQVSGLVFLSFTFLFGLPWSIRVLSLIDCYMDVELPNFYFGCLHCYVYVACPTHHRMNWHSDTELTLTDSFGTFGNGSFWDLYQISEARPVALRQESLCTCTYYVSLGLCVDGSAATCYHFDHYYEDSCVVIFGNENWLETDGCLSLCIDESAANCFQFDHYYADSGAVNFGDGGWMETDGCFLYSNPHPGIWVGGLTCFFQHNLNAYLFRLPVGLVDKPPHGGWLLIYMISIPPSPWRHYPQNCQDQHVNMLWLHLCMIDQPICGGWPILCISLFLGSACLLAELLVSNFASYLSWAFSYSLLSLSRACKHAQEHVALGTCCCWHLDLLPRPRDEVKEECPIVYEDNLSETKAYYLAPCLPLILWCYFLSHQQNLSVCDLMTETWHTLQDFVDVTHDPWAVTGFHISHCFLDQRPDSPSAVYYTTFSTRTSVMTKDLVMFIIQIEMYWYPGNVLARLHCKKFDVVFFNSRCVTILENYCKRCFSGKFDQHLSMLGPCHMALELHLRMLGKVYSGIYCSFSLFLAGVVVVVTSPLCLQVFRFCYKSFEQHSRVLRPCYKALEKHLRMLGQAVAQIYSSYYNDALEWNDLCFQSALG